MPDDKRGREEQAAHQERRQRERELAEARERGGEPEPETAPGFQLGALDVALERHEFPTTSTELVDAFGDFEIETQDGVQTVESLLAPIESETYDTPDEVRRRLLDLIGR